MQLSSALAGPGKGSWVPRQQQQRFVNPVHAAAATSRPVIGYVATSEAKQKQPAPLELLDAGGVVTLKERAMDTAAFRMLQDFMESKVGWEDVTTHGCATNPQFVVHPGACTSQQAVLPPNPPSLLPLLACVTQPSLQADWLSFTSRPWVQGPVDAFLGNTQLVAMMAQHKELAATVEGLVSTLDTALVQVRTCSRPSKQQQQRPLLLSQRWIPALCVSWHALMLHSSLRWLTQLPAACCICPAACACCWSSRVGTCPGSCTWCSTAQGTRAFM